MNPILIRTPRTHQMIGTQIGVYRVEEKLGEGGMGVVYRALDTPLQRTVALKFLPPSMSSDEDAKRRFMREAQAAFDISREDPKVREKYGRHSLGQRLLLARRLAEVGVSFTTISHREIS